MRTIFSIEFEYRNKKYSGIVRTLPKENCTEYHVRVMNARLDGWLFGHHVYTLCNGMLTAGEAMCAERTQAIRAAVYYSLQAHLLKSVTGSEH
jgi:hypothetical protein